MCWRARTPAGSAPAAASSAAATSPRPTSCWRRRGSCPSTGASSDWRDSGLSLCIERRREMAGPPPQQFPAPAPLPGPASRGCCALHCGPICNSWSCLRCKVNANWHAACCAPGKPRRPQPVGWGSPTRAVFQPGGSAQRRSHPGSTQALTPFSGGYGGKGRHRSLSGAGAGS